MADVQVKTKTSITREQLVPETDVIALLKLDMSNGSLLIGTELIGKDGVNMVKFVTREPEQSTDAVIPIS